MSSALEQEFLSKEKIFTRQFIETAEGEKKRILLKTNGEKMRS